MSEINIHDSNKLIIDKYFNNLTCDEYTESMFSGGQSQVRLLKYLSIINLLESWMLISDINKS